MSEWIVVDPNICADKPTIKGTRIMVKNILGMMAGGYTVEKVFRYDSSLQVERDLVRIRGAIAHGRIASKSSSATAACKLVKYSDPRKDPIKVMDCYRQAELEAASL